MKIISIIIAIACLFAINNASESNAPLGIKYGVSVPISYVAIDDVSEFGYGHNLDVQFNYNSSISVGMEAGNALYLTMATDTREVRFVNYRAGLYVSWVKNLVWRLNYILVGGAGYSYTKGHKDEFTGMMPSSPKYPYETLSENVLYANGMLGLEMNFFMSRFGFEIIPFNVSIGNHGYLEITPKLVIKTNLF